jgi:hypothetical protein
LILTAASFADFQSILATATTRCCRNPACINNHKQHLTWTQFSQLQILQIPNRFRQMRQLIVVETEPAKMQYIKKKPKQVRAIVLNTHFPTIASS